MVTIGYTIHNNKVYIMFTCTGKLLPLVPKTEIFEWLTGNLRYQFHSLASGL